MVILRYYAGLDATEIGVGARYSCWNGALAPASRVGAVARAALAAWTHADRWLRDGGTIMTHEPNSSNHHEELAPGTPLPPDLEALAARLTTRWRLLAEPFA